MSDDAAAPYDALAELAERELLLVSAPDGPDADALAALERERAALVARLPAQPPAAAEPALARAARAQAGVTRMLAQRVAELRRTLVEVDRGRRTARGYGGGPAPRPSLDRAA